LRPKLVVVGSTKCQSNSVAHPVSTVFQDLPAKPSLLATLTGSIEGSRRCISSKAPWKRPSAGESTTLYFGPLQATWRGPVISPGLKTTTLPTSVFISEASGLRGASTHGAGTAESIFQVPR